MKIHTIKGAGGVNLHVREYGKLTGIPILLIHGWSQSHLCWSKQYESTLNNETRIVALDLRGHGMSDAPVQVEQYTDGDKWADDIAAVIDELALDRPILVGWSYGGYIISDYVRRNGQEKIAGINFVDAAVVLGPQAFFSMEFPNHVALILAPRLGSPSRKWSVPARSQAARPDRRRCRESPAGPRVRCETPIDRAHVRTGHRRPDYPATARSP